MTITVTLTVRDRDGEPDPAGGASFELVGTLIDDGRVVLPQRKYIEADANGQVSADLWPNNGPETSRYEIVTYSGDQEMLRARLALTESGDLEALL